MVLKVRFNSQMRMSHLFGRTLREAPGDVELPSHRLMLRAALIRPLGAGIYSLLPLGWRVVRKVEQIIREEMNAIGGQEMLMPVVHPADIWRESGRYDAVGPEMTRFKDRGDRDMVLAMTHEEIVTDLARQEINSYRQLPHDRLSHPDQVARRAPLPRRPDPGARVHDEGLLHPRPRTRRDWTRSTRTTGEPTSGSSAACGLDFVVVGADTGMMGGTASHEFMALSPVRRRHRPDLPEWRLRRQPRGGDRSSAMRRPRKRCCRWKRSRRRARRRSRRSPTSSNVPLAKTAKAVFYKGDSGRFVFAVIRGDLDVNETKLRKAAGEIGLTPATVEEIRAIGAEPGYGSPVGVRDALIVIDESVRDTPNLVAGANRVGWHVLQHQPRPRLRAPTWSPTSRRPRQGSPARTAARR